MIQDIFIISRVYQQAVEYATERALPSSSWQWFPQSRDAADWVDLCRSIGIEIDPTYVYPAEPAHTEAA